MWVCVFLSVKSISIYSKSIRLNQSIHQIHAGTHLSVYVYRSGVTPSLGCPDGNRMSSSASWTRVISGVCHNSHTTRTRNRRDTEVVIDRAHPLTYPEQARFLRDFKQAIMTTPKQKDYFWKHARIIGCIIFPSWMQTNYEQKERRLQLAKKSAAHSPPKEVPRASYPHEGNITEICHYKS